MIETGLILHEVAKSRTHEILRHLLAPPAFWEVGATIDHVVPVTRGGADDESNWVTTSMARNSAKMNWTLEELGWTLHPPGNHWRMGRPSPLVEEKGRSGRSSTRSEDRKTEAKC
jgi:HNH endonuclease